MQHSPQPHVRPRALPGLEVLADGSIRKPDGENFRDIFRSSRFPGGPLIRHPVYRQVLDHLHRQSGGDGAFRLDVVHGRYFCAHRASGVLEFGRFSEDRIQSMSALDTGSNINRIELSANGAVLMLQVGRIHDHLEFFDTHELVLGNRSSCARWNMPRFSFATILSAALDRQGRYAIVGGSDWRVRVLNLRIFSIGQSPTEEHTLKTSFAPTATRILRRGTIALLGDARNGHLEHLGPQVLMVDLVRSEPGNSAPNLLEKFGVAAADDRGQPTVLSRIFCGFGN